MARTAITPLAVNASYPVIPLVANSLDVALTTGDATDGHKFRWTGKEVLLVQNSHASTAYTFTILSVADAQGRTGDLGPYTLQAGEIARIQLPKSAGIVQTDGYVYVNVNNAAIKLAVVAVQ